MNTHNNSHWGCYAYYIWGLAWSIHCTVRTDDNHMCFQQDFSTCDVKSAVRSVLCYCLGARLPLIVCFLVFSEIAYCKKTGFIFTVTQKNEELVGHEELLSLCYKKC